MQNKGMIFKNNI